MVKIHVLLHIACHRQRWHEVTPLGCYTWELKSLLFGKISGHNRIYKTCFSPLWVNRCLFRSPALLNDFSHCAHLCSLTPLWVSRCLFRSPACLNDLLHCPHLWGFSPLWVSRWVLRDPAWLNDLLHCPHLCTFSPVSEQMHRNFAGKRKRLDTHGARMFVGHISKYHRLLAGQVRGVGVQRLCFMKLLTWHHL